MSDRKAMRDLKRTLETLRRLEQQEAEGGEACVSRHDRIPASKVCPLCLETKTASRQWSVLEGRLAVCLSCHRMTTNGMLENEQLMLRRAELDESFADELLRTLQQRVAQLQRPVLLPMSSAPRNGTYVVLFADSGYTNVGIRCQVCRYDPTYRPLNPWQTYSNEAFIEGSGQPIGWLPLPTTGGE